MNRRMYLAKFILLVCFTAACTEKVNSKVKSSEDSNMGQLEVAGHAEFDFNEVIAGRRPKYAIRDLKKPDLADGGTAFYRGVGYSLTVKKTLSRKKEVGGYEYGPILKFDNTEKEISKIKFYSEEDLRKLLNK